LQFLYDLLPSNATNQNVVWSIDQGGSGSGAITANGLFTGDNPGTVTVRATAADGSGVYGSMQVTVTAPTYLVNSITISATDGAISLNAGSTLQLTATILPENATNKSVKWSIIDGSAANVNETSGLVTGTGAGEVTVQCAAQDGSGVSQTYTLTVIQTTGDGPKAIGTSGKKYDTYCYPNGLGCWTANIAEEGQSETTYTGKTEGERGYYYTWANASGACAKVDGYALPTQAQWNALKTYVNTSGTPAADKNFFLTGAALAGYVRDSDHLCGVWDGSAYWWSEHTNLQYFAVGGGSLNGPLAYGGYLMSVRCVLEN
jgi:hypothetical protein